jgi:phosphate transport system permease protein
MVEAASMNNLSGSRTMRDCILLAVVWISTSLLAAVFLWIASDLLLQGASALNWSFLTSAPLNAGRGGGIAPILVSTLLILVVAIAVAAPLGLATAILLTEFTRAGSIFSRWTSLSLDVLAGVPSIVFGLFGNAFFSVWLNLGYSILSGGLTLACMALPVMVRTAEQGLRMVPSDWRDGAAALGVSRTTALWQIFVPAATPALTAGLMLGIGRAMAETAALVFTSGYVDRMPSSFWDSGRALSVHIYDLSMNVAGGDRNAYGSALVLIALLTLINSAAFLFTDRMFQQRISTS